jgi:hypothetical protein
MAQRFMIDIIGLRILIMRQNQNQAQIFLKSMVLGYDYTGLSFNAYQSIHHEVIYGSIY